MVGNKNGFASEIKRREIEVCRCSWYLLLKIENNISGIGGISKCLFSPHLTHKTGSTAKVSFIHPYRYLNNCFWSKNRSYVLQRPSLCLHQTLLLVRCVHRTAASRLRRTATFWSSLWCLSEPWLWWWWWWWPWSARVVLQLSRGSKSLTGQMIHVATVADSLVDDVLNVSSHKPHGWFTSWL